MQKNGGRALEHTPGERTVSEHAVGKRWDVLVDEFTHGAERGGGWTVARRHLYLHVSGTPDRGVHGGFVLGLGQPVDTVDLTQIGVGGQLRRLRDPTAQPDGRISPGRQDRKSTRLNSSHVSISYAVVGFNK